MQARLNISGIQHFFEDKDFFTKKEIRDFYVRGNQNLSVNVLNWRIYKLIDMEIIERLGRGKYKIGKRAIFHPELSVEGIAIGKTLKHQFPFTAFCIWDTALLNLLSLHQSFQRFKIVEAERDSLEAVFLFLKEKYSSVFLKPSRELVGNYLLEMDDLIIVQLLSSEAPLQTIAEIPTVTLEKLLVDVVCNQEVFYFYQGYELVNIFRQAFENYSVNESRLLRYARRRKKEADILHIIKTMKEE